MGPRGAAWSKLRMFNVERRHQTFVVSARRNPPLRHRNPIEIHGTAATTSSPINNAKR
jgi:hypothetical protein